MPRKKTKKRQVRKKRRKRGNTTLITIQKTKPTRAGRKKSKTREVKNKRKVTGKSNKRVFPFVEKSFSGKVQVYSDRNSRNVF